MPSAHYLHPEFGYLCPTSRLRRELRVAAVSALVGALVGVGLMIKTDYQHTPGGDAPTALAMTASALSGVDAPRAVPMQATDAPSAGTTAPATDARAMRAAKDATPPLACRDGSCALKQHRVRVRTATEMPAIAPPATPVGAPVEAGPPAPDPPAAAPAKRPAKTARYQGRRRNEAESGRPWRDERVAVPDGRYLGYVDAHGRAGFPPMFMGWPR
jgi:hypothetical protein